MAVIKVYPSSDVSDGSWTTQVGGTDLSSVLNETTRDDASYVVSSVNPSGDWFEVHLGDPSAAMADGTLSIALGKEANNSLVINQVVQLLQGTTEIASWEYDDVPYGLTLKTEALTSPQFASITDFTDLRVRITASVGVDGEGFSSGFSSGFS